MLLLSEVFPPRTGGSGRWLWEVYRRLPREGVCVAAGEGAGSHEFDATHDVRVTRLPMALADWGLRSAAGRRGYWRLYRQVSQMVVDQRPGAVHAARCLPEGWIARMLSARYGLPYLCYVHGEEMAFAEQSRELRFLSRRVLSAAQLLIANSENTRRLLEDRWSLRGSKIRVMHPGADCSRFVPAEPDKIVREQLGWSGRSVVLTVGRLQKRKGQDMLLRALPAIRQRVPGVLYAIVGDGEERHRLEQLVEELDVREHVQFRGEPDDDELVKCYQQCDLFVLPNRQVGQDFEGFGMVLVEAQACGKPVIAGASGGTAETMRERESGLVVPCDDPHELERVIPELLSDPQRRAQMGAAGRQWAVEQFDWDSLTEQAKAVFAEMGTGSRRDRRVIKAAAV